MKVFIYRNLNRKGVVYSIKAMDGPHKGLVLGYAQNILLINASFKVSEAGRQRVLRVQKKNVHAGAVGTIVAILDPIERIPNTLSHFPQYDWPDSMFLKHRYKVKYNPYKYKTFVGYKKDPEKTTELYDVGVVSLRPTGVYAWLFVHTLQDIIDTFTAAGLWWREWNDVSAGERYVVSDTFLIAW